MRPEATSKADCKNIFDFRFAILDLNKASAAASEPFKSKI